MTEILRVNLDHDGTFASVSTFLIGRLRSLSQLIRLGGWKWLQTFASHPRVLSKQAGSNREVLPAESEG